MTDEEKAAHAEIILSQYYGEYSKPERWLFDGVPMSAGGLDENAMVAKVSLDWTKRVDDSLQAIPFPDRELIQLYLMQGVSLDDVADWNGTSREGVRHKAATALRLFYREFMARG